MLLLILFALSAAPVWTRSEIVRQSDSSVHPHLPLKLSCPTTHLIILEGVWHNFNSKPRLNCTQVGQVCCEHFIHLPHYEQNCNGKSECSVTFKTMTITNKTSSCLTKSRDSVVNYNCVPRKTSQYKSYEICSIENLVLEDPQGFIQSPDYPNYYGNHRQCLLNIRLPEERKVEFYLISMSLEGFSSIQGKAKDFLAVDHSYTMYGTLRYPIQIGNKVMAAAGENRTMKLYFETDWITTTRLASPKGFLIYYEIFDLPSKTSALDIEEADLEDVKAEFASFLGSSSPTEPSETSATHQLVTSIGLAIMVFGFLGIAFLVGRRLSNRGSGSNYIVRYYSQEPSSEASLSYHNELNEKLRRMQEEEPRSTLNDSLLTSNSTPNEYEDIHYIQSNS